MVVRLIEYTFSSKPGQQRHYIVEEFIDGQDLRNILKPNHPWPVQQVASLFCAVCDGLSALNAKGIVSS